MTTSRLSRNTITLLVSNIGSAGLSFLLYALIGRTQGENGLGIYATALAWVFPLSLAAEFGLGTLMTRDLALAVRAAPEYLRATTQARLWIGGGLTLALVLLAPIITPDSSVVHGLQISAPLIMILPFFGAFTAIFRAQQIMWPIPWLNIGMLVIQAGLTALIIALGSGITGILIINTVTSAGQLVAAWAIWKWKFTVSASKAGAEAALQPLQTTHLLRQAWPFALAAILAALQTRTGTILLEQLTNTAQTGYYAAATRFVEAARMIPNALFGALFPALAALTSHPLEMKQTFRRVMLGLALFGATMGILFTIASGYIMRLVYGGKFDTAILTLQIAVWSLLPSLLRAGRTLYWYALKREQFVNVVTVMTLLLQIGLSLWLLPRYGAAGAASVMFITEAGALILLWWPGQKGVGW